MERRSASGVDLDTPMTSGPRERVTAQDWFREDHPLDERHSAIDEVPRRDYAQSSATRFERRTPLHNGSSGNHNLAHRSPPSPDFQVSRDHGYRDPQHHRRLSHPAVSQKPHLAEWDIPSKPTHRNRSWHKPSFGDRNYHPDDRSAFNGRPSAPSGRSSVPPSGMCKLRQNPPNDHMYICKTNQECSTCNPESVPSYVSFLSIDTSQCSPELDHWS